MSATQEPADNPLSLTELFSQYLRRQVASQAEGLGFAVTADEVVPHEAVPVQPVDPRLAWNDALAAGRYYGSSRPAQPWEVPPDWPVLVAAHEPAVSLAFALGNFPQLVRNLYPLLGSTDRTPVRDVPSEPASLSPAMLEWTNGQSEPSGVLLAAAVLRLARRFEESAELLSRRPVPAEWRAAYANEEAAVTWHRGRSEEALERWRAQPASVPVLFNRGMAALFLGRPVEARSSLDEAVRQLPDTSAWHHLGHLYLTLASRT